MRAAFLSVCLLLGGCGIYLDPLYERYLDEGLEGLDDYITNLAIPDAGGSVLAASGSRQTMVWQNNGQWRHWLVEPVPEERNVPHFISMSGDSVGVVFGAAGGGGSPFSVRVFDIESHQLEGQVTVEREAEGFAFLGNNMTFYTAESEAPTSGTNHYLSEYHRIEGESVFTLSQQQPLDFFPKILAACPDNRWLAVCGSGMSEKVQIWDFSSVPAVEMASNEQGGGCDKLAFSRDCKFLAMHSNESSSVIKVFDTSNLAGQPVSELFLEGYDNNGLALALSPDGALLAVVGKFKCADGKECNLTRIYDRQQEKEIFEVSDYREFAQAVVFENDGLRLASGGGSGIVKIWNVEKILQDLR